MKNHDNAAAIEQLRESAKLDPQSAPIYERIGDLQAVLRRCGRGPSLLAAGSDHATDKAVAQTAQRQDLPGAGEVIRLKFWGVRGSTPTPQLENLGYGGNTSCLELRLPDNQSIIFDAGSGLRNLGATLLKEANGANST